MDYRTVAAKLPSNESTMFRTYCERKGVTPASLIRALILKEMDIAVPHIMAGKNKIRYNKNQDSFVWSIELDSGKIIDVLENVSPSYLENLLDTLILCIGERASAIQKKNRDSVPVSSELFRGKPQ